MPDARVVVSGDGLRAFVEVVLRDLSMGARDARLAAEILVRADLRGRHTHGVWFLPTYVRMLRHGGIDATARPSIVEQTAATAIVDGRAALGQLVGHFAAETAIRKARAPGGGIATVLVRNSNHFGAAGYYASMCAEAGLLGIVMSNSRPITTAPGVLGPVLGSAPLAYAIPAAVADGRPIVFDGALSEVAGTRVMQAVERGDAIPEGWIVDRDGQASTAPTDLLEEGAALLPMAGHKGFGLSLLVELFAGVLSGAGVGDGVRSHVEHPELPSLTGHAVLALDVGSFMAASELAERMARLCEAIRAAPRAPDAEPVRMPGEAADAHEAAARAHGLELETIMWARLTRLAEEFGRERDLQRAVLAPGARAAASQA